MYDDQPLGIRVNRAGFQQCGVSWSLTAESTRRWRDLDLWFLVEGHGSVDTPQGVHALHPGTCLILRGGQDYSFRQNPRNRFKQYWVHFDYMDGRGRPLVWSKKPLNLPVLIRRVEKMEFLATLLDRVVAAFHGTPSNPARAAMWFSAALAEATSHDRMTPGGGTDLRLDQTHWIERTLRQIREHPEKTYSIARLARQGGYSRSYFSSLFKSIVGLSPKDYIVKTRMQAAEHLLLDSNYTVSAIAGMLGYQDIYFFSRQFKVHHGLSPLQYRQMSESKA